VDDDVRKGAIVKALRLNVIAQGGEVAVECPELTGGTVVVGVLL
jgi:hypothetical protein